MNAQRIAACPLFSFFSPVTEFNEGEKEETVSGGVHFLVSWSNVKAVALTRACTDSW